MPVRGSCVGEVLGLALYLLLPALRVHFNLGFKSTSMSSESYAQPELPDFDLIANLMVAEGVHVVSPSELHGLLSGHLSAGARLEPAVLLQSACDLMDITAFKHENSKVLLLDMYQQTLLMLEAPELIFELSVPDEEQSLAQRAEGLGQWCQGFLSGFGLYGKHTDKTLSKEAKEAFADLNQIAQIVAGVDDDDGSENDLMEVEEYVRMVVLMLFAECNKAEPPANNSPQKTVH
jgi:uncharacterized protein YgfB (UPF0149 family)